MLKMVDYIGLQREILKKLTAKHKNENDVLIDEYGADYYLVVLNGITVYLVPKCEFYINPEKIRRIKVYDMFNNREGFNSATLASIKPVMLKNSKKLIDLMKFENDEVCSYINKDNFKYFKHVTHCKIKGEFNIVFICEGDEVMGFTLPMKILKEDKF